MTQAVASARPRDEMFSAKPRHEIRGATLADEEQLLALARHLNTVNLPDDRRSVHELLQHAEDSFAGKVSPAKRRYVFLLWDLEQNRAIGSSSIIAQLGRRDAPYIYFDVLDEERYSKSLDKHFHHTILRLGFSYKGPTELGGLVVLPELRRSPERPHEVETVKIGGMVADLARREVRYDDGSHVVLSEREAELLRYLAANSGRAISREELLQRVWQLDPRGLETRTIDMHVARLREKLREDPAQPAVVLTVRGKGYMLAVPAGAADEAGSPSGPPLEVSPPSNEKACTSGPFPSAD